MGDERYDWLDRSTAEKLLRGEPVETPDERTRLQAARLGHALSRTAHPDPDPAVDPGTPLPGEAAAMAAFRAARESSAADRAAAGTEDGTTAPADGGLALGLVQLARQPRRRPGARLGGTMRFATLSAVAVFTFGGVAVAATSGLLPSPFDQREPAGSTVVATAPSAGRSESPHPPGSGPTTDGSPGAPIPAETTGLPGASTPAATRPGERRGKDPRRWGIYNKLMSSCQAYRARTLDPVDAEWLEAVARGPEKIPGFCDRLLSGGGYGWGPGRGGDKGGPGRRGRGAGQEENGSPGERGERNPGSQGHQHGKDSKNGKDSKDSKGDKDGGKGGDTGGVTGQAPGASAPPERIPSGAGSRPSREPWRPAPGGAGVTEGGGAITIGGRLPSRPDPSSPPSALPVLPVR
ncbi:hypothetical protein ACFVIM_12205 [Streptomyces sp. NPDC057638]|uniref:hypothetical protein n=1 Tax=Streptomyces sp. NPDC057638 TaxID=3346190 RepID=UPI0036C65CFB